MYPPSATVKRTRQAGIVKKVLKRMLRANVALKNDVCEVKAEMKALTDTFHLMRDETRGIWC